jgi:hypothetical protein
MHFVLRVQGFETSLLVQGRVSMSKVILTRNRNSKKRVKAFL